MKCKIVLTFLFSATGQYSSNFDLNISAQIRTRSSEEEDETERAPAAATSTCAQPAVNEGVSSRSREEAEQQAALTLECERENWYISDHRSFFRVFTAYRKGGKVDRRMLESFSRHHGGNNFLVRLSSLCHVSRGGLLPLPEPWDWLEKRVPGKHRERAMVAYGHLLDFLEDLLERQGRFHMSKEEVEFRRRHLRAIKNEGREDKQNEAEDCHDGCPAGNDSGLDAGDSLQLGDESQNLSLDSDENRLIIDEDEDAPEEDD